jgi:DNA topoisomerase-2
MYGAPNVLDSQEEIVIENNKIVTKTIIRNELLLKIIDEIISNSVDAHYRNPDECTMIDVKFNSNGRVTIINNGPTIANAIHKQTGFHNIELCFAKLRSGSNFNEERSGRGQNGYGCKLTNIFSKKMVIKCRDGKEQTTLVCSDNMQTVGEVTSKECKSEEQQTVVMFTPDYERLGYANLGEKEIEDISYMIRQRCIQVALSTSLSVYYNGELIDMSFDDLVENPVVLNIDGFCKLYLQSSNEHLSYTFVNSGLVHDGTHINWIANSVRVEYGAQLQKLLDIKNCNRNHVRNCLRIVGWVKVVNPGYEAQNKLELKKPGIAEFPKIDKQILRRIYELVEISITIKSARNKRVKVRKSVKVKCDGLVDAKYAGTSRSDQCTLFISEGLSAQSFDRKGISNKKGTYSGYDYNGSYALGGKIMNVRKQTNVRDVGDNQILEESEKLQESIKINDLLTVIGLTKGYDYDPNTTQGSQELATLRYGKIIISADRDTDGEHITAIVVNMIGMMFPKLLENNYVFRLNTPVLNVFRGKQSIGFDSAAEYERWWEERKADGTLGQYSKPKYHKGLGSWSDKAIFGVFTKIEQHLVRFDIGEECHSELEVYFGKKSNKRKERLLLPAVEYKYARACNSNIVQVKQFLNRELKQYYHDCIARGLSHVIDGLRPTARMLLCGGRIMLRRGFKKVTEASQSIGGKYHYVHGDASINAVMCGRAAEYPGSNLFPLMLGEGQFGDVAQGFRSCASPRYISVMYNVEFGDKMFPPVDDVLLPYRWEEGEICEPLYYVPVLPMAILESFRSVAAGWNTSVLARDVNEVADFVRALIKGEDPQGELSYSKYNHGETNPDHICSQYPRERDIMFVGKATFTPAVGKTKACITVTALPPGMWHNPFANKCEAMKSVYQVVNHSKDRHSSCVIDIEIYLSNLEGVDSVNVTEEELRCGINKYIKYVGAYKPIRSSPNYYTGCIRDSDVCTSYNSYVDVLRFWYAVRKNMYTLRVERRRKIIVWMLILLENSMKYINDHEKYRINKNSKVAAVVGYLESDGFPKLNKTHIRNPHNIPTNELDDYMVEGGSYDYLLKMTDLDKLQEGYDKLANQQRELRSELDMYKDAQESFVGANIWLKEIDEVMTVIDNARKRGGWYVDDKDY